MESLSSKRKAQILALAVQIDIKKVLEATKGVLKKELLETLETALESVRTIEKHLDSELEEEALNCCAKEDRDINGGCRNCGDPSY